MSFPFHFHPEREGTALAHQLRFVWELAEQESEATGFKLSLQEIGSSKPEEFPTYNPATAEATIDLSAKYPELLEQLVEVLSRHQARSVLDGDLSRMAAWYRAANEEAGRIRRVMNLYATARLADAPEPESEPSKSASGIGRGNWERPDIHPMHCQAVKRDHKRCKAMRVKGTAFCHFHQQHRSQLFDFDTILGELEGEGWNRIVTGGEQ